MDILLTAIFVFAVSLFFAFLEIEIEGKHGWAERLPTWYRKSSGLSKLHYLLNSKKPLTGYHLFMLSFIILMFHSGFFFGLAWTKLNEIIILFFIITFLIVEDFLWFQFNPFYGSKIFKKGKIWWNSNQRWILSLPIETFKGIFGILIISLIISAFYQNLFFFYEFGEFILGIVLLIFFSKLLVKPYQNWYKKMRKIDESKFFKRKIVFEKI